jgi:hypothetical protein
MALTRLERNQVFEAIAASTLDPAECKLEQNSNEVIVSHANSGSTFKFTFIGTGHFDIYVVESNVIDGHHLRFQAPREIDSVTPWITTWANEVREIMDAPDLWVEMRHSRDLIAEIQQTDSGNTLFSQDEQGQIAVQLQQITERLKEQFELTNEQMERIEEWREEVVEASTRMGRKDWLIYLLGTITALIITATVPAGIGEHIFTMLIHALGHLFTGGNEPPRLLT